MRNLIRVGRRHAGIEEDVRSASDEVLERVHEAGLTPAHLVPDASERVVDEELDDVPRREELVAKRELVGGTRRLAGLAGVVAKLLWDGVLVDPADRLVLAPDGRNVGLVEELDHALQAGVRRKDDRLWEAPVEENAQLVGEVVEDRLQVEPEPAVEHRPVARRPADLRADYLE